MSITIEDILGMKREGKSPKNLAELLGENRVFEIITPYGFLVFCFKNDRQKNIFETLAKMYIAMLGGAPATIDNLGKLRLQPDDAEMPEVEVDFTSEAEKAEAQKIAGKAFNYFKANLVAMFREAIQQYVEECYTLGILRSADEDEYYVLTVTECEFFRRYSKIANKAMRERMKIKNASGKPVTWTPKKLLGLLKSYENLHDLIKEARDYYQLLEKTAFSKIHDPKARYEKILDRVKMAHPELEETIIDAFKYDSETDSVLAIESLKERTGLKLTISSIESLLVDARKVRSEGAGKPENKKRKNEKRKNEKTT